MTLFLLPRCISSRSTTLLFHSYLLHSTFLNAGFGRLALKLPYVLSFFLLIVFLQRVHIFKLLAEYCCAGERQREDCTCGNRENYSPASAPPPFFLNYLLPSPSLLFLFSLSFSLSPPLYLHPCSLSRERTNQRGRGGGEKGEG